MAAFLAGVILTPKLAESLTADDTALTSGFGSDFLVLADDMSAPAAAWTFTMPGEEVFRFLAALAIRCDLEFF